MPEKRPASRNGKPVSDLGFWGCLSRFLRLRRPSTFGHRHLELDQGLRSDRRDELTDEDLSRERKTQREETEARRIRDRLRL